MASKFRPERGIKASNLCIKQNCTFYTVQPEWPWKQRRRKQTHIPFQLKCLSVATRRTPRRPTPGYVCQAFGGSHGIPLAFSVLLRTAPKRFTKCLFKNSTTNNELCRRRRRGRRAICIILLVNTRYEVSHAHRPPTTHPPHANADIR